MTHARVRVAVIGAGMAGAACARGLSDAGADVHLFEKSRRVGGRMATRRVRWTDEAGLVHDAAFDHGAPGFSAHSAAFAKFVGQGGHSQELMRWTPRMAAGSFVPLDGYQSWIATPRMPDLCIQMINGLPTTFGQLIDELHAGSDGWRVKRLGETLEQQFTHVVTAVPPLQASKLLAPHRIDWAQRGRQQRMLPCWTLMGVAERPVEPLAWDVAWPLGGPLAWIIRNERKPGRTSAAGRVHWVAHANAAWSETHLEAPDDVVHAALLAAIASFVGEPPDWRISQVHRWRYASVARPGSCALEQFWFDADLGLGVCGDYLGGAGVEGAWISGDALATRIAQSCGLGCGLGCDAPVSTGMASL